MCCHLVHVCFYCGWKIIKNINYSLFLSFTLGHLICQTLSHCVLWVLSVLKKRYFTGPVWILVGFINSYIMTEQYNKCELKNVNYRPFSCCCTWTNHKGVWTNGVNYHRWFNSVNYCFFIRPVTFTDLTSKERGLFSTELLSVFVTTYQFKWY